MTNRRSNFVGPSTIKNDPYPRRRRTHQLRDGKKRDSEGRECAQSSAGSARTCRVDTASAKERRTVSPRAGDRHRPGEERSHGTEREEPKRFALIDSEGPLVVPLTRLECTGGTPPPLNSSAMEGLRAARSLSASPPDFSYHPRRPFLRPSPRAFSAFSFRFSPHHLVGPPPISFSLTPTWFNICTQIDNGGRQGGLK